MWSYLTVKWAFEVFIIITRALEVERARSAFWYFSLRNRLVMAYTDSWRLVTPNANNTKIFYTCWFCFRCWYSIKIIMNSHCTNKQCLLLENCDYFDSYKEMNYQAESNRVSMTVISSTSVVISDGFDSNLWFHQFWANQTESRIKCQFWFLDLRNDTRI